MNRQLQPICCRRNIFSAKNAIACIVTSYLNSLRAYRIELMTEHPQQMIYNLGSKRFTTVSRLEHCSPSFSTLHCCWPKTYSFDQLEVILTNVVLKTLYPHLKKRHFDHVNCVRLKFFQVGQRINNSCPNFSCQRYK